MKKLFVFITLLLSFCLHSQTNKVKLKSFSMSNRLGSGMNRYVVVYKANNIEKVIGHYKNWTLKYNATNFLMEIIEKSPDGQFIYKQEYIYNTNNQVVGIRVYRQRNKIITLEPGTDTFVYKGNKLVESNHDYNGTNRKTIYTWNGDNIVSFSEKDALSTYFTKKITYNLSKENKLNAEIPVFKYVYQLIATDETLAPFEFFLGKNEVVEIELQNLYKTKRPYNISAFDINGFPKTIFIDKIAVWNSAKQIFEVDQTFPTHKIEFTYY